MSALLELLVPGQSGPMMALALLSAGTGSFVTRAALGRRVGAARAARLAWTGWAALALVAGVSGNYVLTVRAVFPYLDPGSNLFANPAGPATAVFGAVTSLLIASHARPGYRDLLFAGALLAGSIACMLFMALSSLAQPNRLAWELLPVTGTVLLAAVLYGLGLAGVNQRGMLMQYVQGASCLAAAQIVMSLASLTSILSFSDWLAESGNPGNLSSDPIIIVVTACGLVMAGLALIGARLDHRAAQLNQRESDRMRQLADSALEGILIARDGRVMDANAAFCQLVETSVRMLQGRPVDSLFRCQTDVAPWNTTDAAADHVEIELLPVSGDAIPVEVIARSIRYRDGPVQVLAVRDVRERRKAEDRIRHMAHHDALTGLVNRTLLREKLSQALGSHLRAGLSFAVICLDLDRFKAVNDTLGHACGDQLLVQVAKRLRACVGMQETVARTGGDEFVILQEGGPTAQTLTSLATRLLATVSAPYDLQGRQASIGVSIGIAVWPQDGANVEQLLVKADLALYRAKSEGRGVVCFFEAAMEARMRERRRLERDLRLALGTDQLSLHYQPQFNCADPPVLIGFEALMRWTHPERGRISPSEFVPVAEDTGLIAPLGMWALERACLDAVTWPPHCRISVNLSAAQFRASHLSASVADVLQRTGLSPSRLELEVTESLLIDNPAHALRVLGELKGLGVRIALDDFGTGYSSLSYLQRFPFDKLKIDKSFIDGLDGRDGARGSRGIVEAILSLSRSLGLEVTAEGVETSQQLAFLQELSCGAVQGYFLGRPVPLEQTAKFFGAWIPDSPARAPSSVHAGPSGAQPDTVSEIAASN